MRLSFYNCDPTLSSAIPYLDNKSDKQITKAHSRIHNRLLVPDLTYFRGVIGFGGASAPLHWRGTPMIMSDHVQSWAIMSRNFFGAPFK